MSACEELSDRARMFSIGSKQAKISKKQMNAIIKSPVLLLFDLIILDVLS